MASNLCIAESTVIHCSTHMNCSQNSMADIPLHVLSTVFSLISDPRSVAAAACVCKSFKVAIEKSPLHLSFSSLHLKRRGGAIISTTKQGDLVLPLIFRKWKAITSLDFSGCPVEDYQITSLLGNLPHLEVLALDFCQKLTLHSVQLWYKHSSYDWSKAIGPKFLSLQRCFRITPGVAGKVVQAAMAGSRAECVLFKHLRGVVFPQIPSSETLEGKSTTASELTERQSMDGWTCFRRDTNFVGLKILGLTDCDDLTGEQLLLLGDVCPTLETLLLGGCSHGLKEQLSQSNREQGVPEGGDSSVSSLLLRLVWKLPRLQTLEVTFFDKAVVEALRSQFHSFLNIWDFSEPQSVASALRFLHTQKKERKEEGIEKDELWTPSEPLQEATSSSTHFPPPPPPHSPPPPPPSPPPSSSSSSPYLPQAIASAVNCCNFVNRRRSPLHTAAMDESSSEGAGSCEGGVQGSHVEGLLALGAQVAVEDWLGDTAMFKAAEMGHCGAVKALLRGGGDPLSPNKAGENSLYIAALRGHLECVEAMVEHMEEGQGGRGDWTEEAAYGDGWTPLMASVVANRKAIFNYLLRHVMKGPKASRGLSIEYHSLPSRATKLINAQNKYRQTALHIAVKKSKPWFMVQLVRAGASVSVKDSWGETVVDMSWKNGGPTVRNLLQRSLQERQVEIERLKGGPGLLLTSTLSPFAAPFIPGSPSTP